MKKSTLLLVSSALSASFLSFAGPVAAQEGCGPADPYSKVEFMGLEVEEGGGVITDPETGEERTLKDRWAARIKTKLCPGMQGADRTGSTTINRHIVSEWINFGVDKLAPSERAAWQAANEAFKKQFCTADESRWLEEARRSHPASTAICPPAM